MHVVHWFNTIYGVAKAEGECKEHGTSRRENIRNRVSRGAGLRPDWPWLGGRGALEAPCSLPLPSNHRRRARAMCLFFPHARPYCSGSRSHSQLYINVYTSFETHPARRYTSASSPSTLTLSLGGIYTPRERATRKGMLEDRAEEKEGGTSHFSRPTWLSYPIGWPVSRSDLFFPLPAPTRRVPLSISYIVSSLCTLCVRVSEYISLSVYIYTSTVIRRVMYICIYLLWILNSPF